MGCHLRLYLTLLSAWRALALAHRQGVRGPVRVPKPAKSWASSQRFSWSKPGAEHRNIANQGDLRLVGNQLAIQIMSGAGGED